MTKIGLRKAWFQVHKWIGLILSVVILVISFTGAVLVWHDPIDRAMHPERYAVTGSGERPIADYAAAAQARLGAGELLSRVSLPEEAGEPVEATAIKAGEGRPQRLTVYLDPATANVLAAERSGEGIFQVMHVLHGSLMIPEVGRKVVGWIGVAMLVMSVSGLWLWWPLVGGFKRGLRWKRHDNFDTNLHHQFGFWISVPLFVLSATGVWISFPQTFSVFESAETQQRGPGGPGGGPRGRPMPVAAPAEAVGPAVAAAEAAGAGKVVSLGWPTDQKAEWSAEVVTAAGGEAEVKLATADLAPTVEAKEGEPPETLARLMRRIHDGVDMPLWWQIVVFLGGMLPSALAVTGVIMWWRARKWRGELADRKRAKSAAKPA